MKQTKFGSISGLTEKLDYIQDLGVESIWLSPIYEFGGVDYGNDITDHKKIDPLFGTEDDFEALLREVDKRGEYYSGWVACLLKNSRSDFECSVIVFQNMQKRCRIENPV